MSKGRIVSVKASKIAKEKMKTSVFGKFIKEAKSSKSFKLLPKKGTKQYKNMIKP